MLHGSKLASLVKENIEVQAYLDRDLSEAQMIRLKKTLVQKKFVALKNNEPQVEFVSKEEGAKRFIAETGEDFTTFLGDNPLRDMMVLKINAEQADNASLAQIKKELEDISGVYEVTYAESLIDSINRNLKKVSIVLLGFALILLLSAVLLINNTIKLAMFSQRFLIRSMQLVGATGTFIQRPFLNRATWHGLTAGIIAILLLMIVLQYATIEVPELEMLQDPVQIGILMAVILVLGCIIGFIAAYRAVKKYMSLSLDELY
ncbi:MAG: ABC transporter permease [Chitinophagaceae bacterium]|nr:MAG: ABC transporter permease [Chitinophagaceae bacterium]